MYMYVYTYMWNACTHVHIYIDVYIDVYIHVYAYIDVYIDVYIHVHIHVHIHVCRHNDACAKPWYAYLMKFPGDRDIYICIYIYIKFAGHKDTVHMYGFTYVHEHARRYTHT